MSLFPKIKFCGLSSIEEVSFAINNKVSYIGFIFVKDTPRYINFSDSEKIINKFKNKIDFVGVFIDPSNEYIEKAVESGINIIQLHGNEEPSRCKEIGNIFKIPIIKAIPIFNEHDIKIIKEYNDYCDMFLFDTKLKSSNSYHGGTGKTFDWKIIKDKTNWLKSFKPWMLSGGLAPDNIRTAINISNPHYIDVSSGIEYDLGKKSKKLMKDFILNVYN